MSAKYRVIERFREKYPIQKMCDLFEVSRSGFYKWRKRASQPQQRSELDQFIIECQAQVKQSYGYRRVWLWMKQNKAVECHPWVTPEDVRRTFPDVTFAVHFSCNSMKEKRGKAPRSKFHVLFLIEEMTDPAEYSALKKRVNNIFCFPFSHCSNCSPYSRYTSF